MALPFIPADSAFSGKTFVEQKRGLDPGDPGIAPSRSHRLHRIWGIDEERQVTIPELEALAKKAARIAAPVFAAAGWKWVGRGVPGETEIEMTALRLLLECPLHGVKATGGIHVTRQIADRHETFSVKLDLGNLVATDPFPGI